MDLRLRLAVLAWAVLSASGSRPEALRQLALDSARSEVQELVEVRDQLNAAASQGLDTLLEPIAVLFILILSLVIGSGSFPGFAPFTSMATSMETESESPETAQGRSVGCRIFGGCGGCFCAYILLMLVPILLVPASEIIPGIDAEVPGAALIIEEAMKELMATDLAMTAQVIKPDGEVIGRKMSPGGATYTFGIAFYKFRDLKAKDWDTTNVCDAGSSCVLRSMATIGFNRHFSCPGAVVLYKNNTVIGVVAMSGGSAAEDNAVVSAAVLKAGYKTRGDKRAQFDYEGLGDDTLSANGL